MKRLKQILSLILILLMLCPLLPAASAEDALAAKYEGKSWDELVQEILDRYGARADSVTLGYYNTVTGEEQYWDADKYMVSGSMYKVPLNMVYLDKIAAGEMDMDSSVGGIAYRTLLEDTIVHSSNDYAKTLWSVLGNGVYRQYRRIIAPIMGEDADTVDAKFYENNFFTARQMMTCLKTLYDGKDDRYAALVDAMQRAEPDEYFKRRERDYGIAHKYGFLDDPGHFYMTDCAIAFTDDPILFVMFTDNTAKAYEVMADFAVVMCEYTQYHTALRKQEEAERAAEAERRAQETREALEREQAAEAASHAGVTGHAVELAQVVTEDGRDRSALYAGGGVLAVLLISLVALLIWAGRRRRRVWPQVLLLLLATLAALLCIFLPFLQQPKENPQTVVTAFFDCLAREDYEAAYTLLADGADLGLQEEPQGANARAVAQALRMSYSAELFGECRVGRQRAHQLVEMRFLDVTAMEPELQSAAQSWLVEYAEGRTAGELYDENGEYLPEVQAMARTAAVEAVLKHVDDYITTTGFQLELIAQNGRWRIIPGTNLLRALLGGVAIAAEGEA